MIYNIFESQTLCHSQFSSKCCNKAHNNKIMNEMSRTREVGEVGFVAGGIVGYA